MFGWNKARGKNGPSSEKSGRSQTTTVGKFVRMDVVVLVVLTEVVTRPRQKGGHRCGLIDLRATWEAPDMVVLQQPNSSAETRHGMVSIVCSLGDIPRLAIDCWRWGIHCLLAGVQIAEIAEMPLALFLVRNSTVWTSCDPDVPLADHPLLHGRPSLVLSPSLTPRLAPEEGCGPLSH